ncbi:MAG TPA: HD-GYP domain-containing protein [Aquabacterium sp.]|nr:HD-GYP domain-containing protein [Aquabacterium sp.]
MNFPAQALIGNTGTLTDRLSALHDRLLQTVPAIDRIACTLYDAQDDKLKTFINSTRHGEALQSYEASLSASASLREMAESGGFRVLDDIAQAIRSDSAHSQWLLEQGYQSSFTVPYYEQTQLLGFIFFDSMLPAAFTPEVQRDLVLYTTLISMLISSEISTVRMILESTRVARELTQVRDFETGAHLDRMAHYARLIAQALATSHNLSDESIESIFLFAPLHDIGKIGIPDRILLKSGKLDEEERRIMNSHVDKGIEIIDRILGKEGAQHLPDSSVLRHIVHCHHELMDGTGYPRGLRGDAIPLEARIVTVADIFDALTNDRPYKKQWSVPEALAELERMAAQGKVDTACVHALASRPEAVQAIRIRFADSAAAR